MELAVLECLNNFHLSIMGKWCLPAGVLMLNRLIIKVTGNVVKHKAETSLISGTIRPLT